MKLILGLCLALQLGVPFRCDVNGDGRVSATDLVLVRLMSAGVVPPSASADINYDLRIDENDLHLFRLKLAGEREH